MPPSVVLVVGATGKTGRRLVKLLLDKEDVQVRAIVRSTAAFPKDILANERLEIVQASLLDMPSDQLKNAVHNCHSVVSCLGHNPTFEGLFGQHRLCLDATSNLCDAISQNAPSKPVKFVLLNTVLVENPDGSDQNRTWMQRLFISVLAFVLPPMKDNMLAANYLINEVRTSNPHVEYCVVRPDALLEGDQVSEYQVHQTFVTSVFKPLGVRRVNVAHFMADLVTQPVTWQTWKFKMPVIADVPKSQLKER